MIELKRGLPRIDEAGATALEFEGLGCLSSIGLGGATWSIPVRARPILAEAETVDTPSAAAVLLPALLPARGISGVLRGDLPFPVRINNMLIPKEPSDGSKSPFEGSNPSLSAQKFPFSIGSTLALRRHSYCQTSPPASPSHPGILPARKLVSGRLLATGRWIRIGPRHREGRDEGRRDKPQRRAPQLEGHRSGTRAASPRRIAFRSEIDGALRPRRDRHANIVSTLCPLVCLGNPQADSFRSSSCQLTEEWRAVCRASDIAA